MAAKKMGRPLSDNPKSNRFNVRLDDKTLALLEEYCLKTGMKKTDVIRQGLLMILEKAQN